MFPPTRSSQHMSSQKWSDRLLFLFSVFIILPGIGCTSSKKSFNTLAYTLSRKEAVYSNVSKITDDVFVLKRNNYFTYYRRLWLVINIRMNRHGGSYSRSGDTLFLNWQGVNPEKINPVLSCKCVISPDENELCFLSIDSVLEKNCMILEKKK